MISRTGRNKYAQNWSNESFFKQIFIGDSLPKEESLSEDSEVLLEKIREHAEQKTIWRSPSDLKLEHTDIPFPLQREKQIRLFSEMMSKVPEMDLGSKSKTEEWNKKLDEAMTSASQRIDNRLVEIKQELKKWYFVENSFQMKHFFVELLKKCIAEWDRRSQKLQIGLERVRTHQINRVEQQLELELRNIAKVQDDTRVARTQFLANRAGPDLKSEYDIKLRHEIINWSKYFAKAHRREARFKKDLIKQLKAEHNAKLLLQLYRVRLGTMKMVTSIMDYFDNYLEKVGAEAEDMHQKVIKCHDLKDRLEKSSPAWACIVKDLMEQFQKFITFALKEVPAQAEFLLDTSKKMYKISISRAKALAQFYHQLDFPDKEVKTWEEALFFVKESQGSVESVHSEHYFDDSLTQLPAQKYLSRSDLGVTKDLSEWVSEKTEEVVKALTSDDLSTSESSEEKQVLCCTEVDPKPKKLGKFPWETDDRTPNTYPLEYSCQPEPDSFPAQLQKYIRWKRGDKEDTCCCLLCLKPPESDEILGEVNTESSVGLVEKNDKSLKVKDKKEKKKKRKLKKLGPSDPCIDPETALRLDPILRTLNVNANLKNVFIRP